MAHGSRPFAHLVGGARCTRSTGWSALAVILFVLSLSPRASAADPQAGHDLAQRWCTSCHIIDKSGQGPDTAPAFPTVAQRSKGDRNWVRAWLAAPHPPMPNFNLSRQQIEDIIAYLDSLTPR